MADSRRAFDGAWTRQSVVIQLRVALCVFFSWSGTWPITLARDVRVVATAASLSPSSRCRLGSAECLLIFIRLELRPVFFLHHCVADVYGRSPAEPKKEEDAGSRTRGVSVPFFFGARFLPGFFFSYGVFSAIGLPQLRPKMPEYLLGIPSREVQ